MDSFSVVRYLNLVFILVVLDITVLKLTAKMSAPCKLYHMASQVHSRPESDGFGFIRLEDRKRLEAAMKGLGEDDSIREGCCPLLRCSR
jgi:hypothetical protein